MIAEILSTGNEVLLGDIVDTNSSYLCRRLKEIGITVAGITAVGDDVETICRRLQRIAGRADVCLVTGGLGPTQDDVTAEACAAAAGTELALDNRALASMEVFFAMRGYEITPANRKQAMLPAGADVIENNWGTAPGFGMTIKACRFFFMPGVPSEMTAMFRARIRPQLSEMTGDAGEINVQRLMVFGLGESAVGERLDGFDERFPGIHLGFRARFPLIEVKLVAGGDDGPEPDMAGAKDWIAVQLGSKVISHEGLTLAEETGRLLARAGQTLSVAESCTGGLIANMITDVPGASDYFLFSATTYANSAKTDILGVGAQTLIDHGAVHEETAREMAAGARRAGRSDWAVSTTGIAGPAGGTDEKPVGTVCIGVAGPDGASARRFVRNMGDRGRNKQIFAAIALEMLRRELAKA